jgi:hypothetical protein
MFYIEMVTFVTVTVRLVGRDSAVGTIATRYRLEDPRIKFLWGCGFAQTSRPTPGPT